MIDASLSYSRLLAAVARRAALALSVAFALGAAAPVALVTPSQARGAPESLADLTDQVIDAVVNIAASTRPAAGPQARRLPVPPTPRGSPFEEFFEEFFNRRGEAQPPGAPPSGPPGQGQGPQPQPRRGVSQGSGFVIDPSGIVITNNHVVGEATDIEVIFNDGTKLKAKVLGKDPKVDLAVLKVEAGRPLKFVPFGDSDKLRRGDWVLAIGNPFGLGGSVSTGIVSALNRNIDSGNYDAYIQTDAAINKGNSGGPLFNMNGEVIGINTAILSPSGGSVGIGFAVPSALATPIIEQLKEFGETRRGWLGVRIQPVDDNTAEALGLGKPVGALIAGVDEKGPAKPGGIEVGDVILSFDGKEIKASRDLQRIVAQTTVGKAVDVVILRKGERVVKQVTLARLEDAERATIKPAAAPGDTQPEVKKSLGIEMSAMTDPLRRRFSIKDTVKGVVVMAVDPNSNAADKRIQPGDVIVEVGQQTVAQPEEVTARVEQLKKEGKKSALLLIANASGEVRFVAVTME